MDLRRILASGIEQLRRVASYDAEIGARVRAGEADKLEALLQRRSAALARLKDIAEELKKVSLARADCADQEADLQGVLRTLAEDCLATTNDHINRLAEQIACLQKKLDSLQASRPTVRCYLVGQEAQRANFTG